jgi:hypothetical protein
MKEEKPVNTYYEKKTHHHGMAMVIFTIFVCFALIKIYPLWADQKVAIITDVKGAVTIKRPQASKTESPKAYLLSLLSAGDIVEGGAGTKATIAFNKDGTSIAVTGPFMARVLENGLYDMKLKKDMFAQKASLSVSIKPHQIELAHAGAVQTRKLVAKEPSSALHPYYFNDQKGTSNTASKGQAIEEKIAKTRPYFMWYTPSAIKPYRFIFIDCMTMGNKERQRKIAIKENGFAQFPQNEPELTRGNDYMWRLSNDPAGEDNPPREDEYFTFNVLSKERAEELERDRKKADECVSREDISPYVSLISIYLNNRLYGPALDLAYRLRDEYRPGDPAITDLLEGVYGKMGLTNVFPVRDEGSDRIKVQQWEKLRKLQNQQDDKK